jgi:hypothetical protein
LNLAVPAPAAITTPPASKPIRCFATGLDDRAFVAESTAAADAVLYSMPFNAAAT